MHKLSNGGVHNYLLNNPSNTRNWLDGLIYNYNADSVNQQCNSIVSFDSNSLP